MRCQEKIQDWRTSPYQLAHRLPEAPHRAEARAAAWWGRAQNLVPLCAHFVQISIFPYTLAHIQV